MSRSLTFSRPISHEFLTLVCRKLSFFIPTAGVKQSAKVLGTLVLLMFPEMLEDLHEKTPMFPNGVPGQRSGKAASPNSVAASPH